jgi:hypothetical protein
MGIGILRACELWVGLLREPERGITPRCYCRVTYFAIVLTKNNGC